MKGKIRNNQGKFLYKRSRRISIWQVEHAGQEFKVVYDKLRGEIVTFLPQELEDDGNETNEVVGGV